MAPTERGEWEKDLPSSCQDLELLENEGAEEKVQELSGQEQLWGQVQPQECTGGYGAGCV